jgi:hypothetical protein
LTKTRLLWALEALYWIAMALLPLQIVDLQVEMEMQMGCLPGEPCYKGAFGFIPPQMVYLYAAILIWPLCIFGLRRLVQKMRAGSAAAVEAEPEPATEPAKSSRRRRRR